MEHLHHLHASCFQIMAKCPPTLCQKLKSLTNCNSCLGYRNGRCIWGGGKGGDTVLASFVFPHSTKLLCSFCLLCQIAFTCMAIQKLLEWLKYPK